MSRLIQIAFSRGKAGAKLSPWALLIVNRAGVERADNIYIHDNYFDHSTVGSFTYLTDQYS